METKISSMPANEIEAWEDEGGATPHPLNAGPVLMTGTASQVEWAERIKLQVNDEFDRVAAAFQAVADKQDDRQRTDTEAIIAILEDKRAEVMRKRTRRLLHSRLAGDQRPGAADDLRRTPATRRSRAAGRRGR